jgi:hypothetical protein
MNPFWLLNAADAFMRALAVVISWGFIVLLSRDLLGG